jgi:HK97 family phage prohead protease
MTTAQFLAMCDEMIRILQSATNRAIVRNVRAEVNNGNAKIAQGIAEIRDELQGSDRDPDDTGLEDALVYLRETVAEHRSQKLNCEFRNAKITSQFERAEEKGKRDKMLIRGYPILFNSPTKVRDGFVEYEEIVLPNALDQTDLSDVYLLGGHNPDNLLGRTGKNMRVEKDENGLFFECDLPNTQYARDIYNLVESGILDGMSFGFNCEFARDKNNRNEIRKIINLYEITLTPFPAYAEASVVATQKIKDVDKATKRAEQEKAEQEAKLREFKKKLEAV